MAQKLALKKSVGAIHSKPDNALTLLQRKLFNICLFHSYHNLLVADEHRIHIDALHEYLGYRGNNWTKIEQAFQGLQSTLVCWNLFGQADAVNEQVSWTRVQYIGSVSWDKVNREFVYTFDKKLSQKLYRPERYAIICLEVQKCFRSEHALVLYEQCVRYRTNVNGSKWFTIDELKDVLAVDRAAYPKFKQFNSRVIKPAISEINAVSDIQVEMHTKKQQRSVVAVKFMISKNEKPDSNLIAGNSESSIEIRTLLKYYKLNDRIINRLLSQYESGRIRSAVDYIKNLPESKQKSIKNPAAYLLHAIENNYQAPVNTMYEKGWIISKAKEIVAMTKKLYMQEKKSALDLELSKLDKTNKDNFLKSFEKFAEKDLVFVRKNLGHKYPGKLIYDAPMIQAKIYEFSKEIFGFVYISFDEFIKKQPKECQSAWSLLQHEQMEE